MEDKLVRFKNYEKLEEAMLDQRILSDNKIPSTIHNSNTAQILPMLYEIDEGIALMLFEKDIKNAWEILKEYHEFK